MRYFIKEKIKGNNEYKPKKHLALNEDEQYDLTFMHKEKEKEFIFALSTGINTLVSSPNCWMYWYTDKENTYHAMYITDKKGIKDIVKKIREKTSKIYYDSFPINLNNL